jgi:myosin-1
LLNSFCSVPLAFNNSAQEAVGLNKSARLAVFKLVATVLFLGNISFGETASETAFVEENGMAERAAALLGSDPEGLKAALITKTVEAAGESIQGSNNMDQAKKVRDALAKALYDKLFEWLITVVNDALEAAQSAITQSQDSSGERLYIGVLDIYGFEIFERNGFEQLCINYVNEQLQQIFIEQVLRAEQDEYAREGIQWQPIKFFNNKVVVDLIDSAKV